MIETVINPPVDESLRKRADGTIPKYDCPTCGVHENEYHADGCVTEAARKAEALRRVEEWAATWTEQRTESVKAKVMAELVRSMCYSVTTKAKNQMGECEKTVTFQTLEEMMAYLKSHDPKI